MLEVWNSRLLPWPVNMLPLQELESHEKLTQHFCSKSNDRPIDRYRPVIARFTFYKPSCNHSRAATKPGDAPGTRPSPPLRCRFPPRILYSGRSLETLPEPHRQGQH